MREASQWLGQCCRVHPRGKSLVFRKPLPGQNGTFKRWALREVFKLFKTVPWKEMEGPQALPHSLLCVRESSGVAVPHLPAPSVLSHLKATTQPVRA